MNLAVMIKFENHLEQQPHWPQSGRHILAHYDEDNIVVYQSFRPEIAEYALNNQRFGGSAYSFTRMSWIKPNFLWMMYRNGWGTKEGQEYTLAITIPRLLFDDILGKAAWSSFKSERYDNYSDWETHKNKGNVRLQWDPDHDPLGNKLSRRAIQLGLKSDTLKIFNQQIISIEDLSPHVAKQKLVALSGNWERLVVPSERPYIPSRNEAISNVLIERH